jgi:RNA polymerase sigma-70 factor (ECF subfamily)
MQFFRPDGEREALKGALEGDTEMFGVLVRRYQAGVIGFCAAMLPYGQGAEDAAQEVFIKAFKSLETFRGDSAFSTWLYRIAFNHCCNLNRSSARRRTDSLEDLPEAVREKAVSRTDPEEKGRPELDALAAALARLPGRYRALIALRLQGEDYRSMAAALGLSLEAVRARLRRARLLLRRDLRHFLP